MVEDSYKPYKIACFILVLLMTVLQGIYALHAYIDPSAFSVLRGTVLTDIGDADWVRIYASRTLFLALIIGYLLYLQNYNILKWAAIFGLVMPVTDAVLAYHAQAATQVLFKHIGTAGYLLVTFFVLHRLTKRLSKDAIRSTA